MFGFGFINIAILFIDLKYCLCTDNIADLLTVKRVPWVKSGLQRHACNFMAMKSVDSDVNFRHARVL